MKWLPWPSTMDEIAKCCPKNVIPFSVLRLDCVSKRRLLLGCNCKKLRKNKVKFNVIESDFTDLESKIGKKNLDKIIQKRPLCRG